MPTHRIILEIETDLDVDGVPLLPAAGVVLLSQSTPTTNDGFMRVTLSPQGFTVADPNASLNDPTQSGALLQSMPFRHWHTGAGFKLRMVVAAQDQRDITIADLPDWAAAELIITTANRQIPPRREPLLTTIGSEQIIGRSQRRANIFIDDGLMSATHLAIHCEPSGYSVEDLRTHNGTLLNGNPLLGRQGLNHGDKLQIGDTRIEYCNVMEIIERVVPRSTDPSVVDLRARVTEISAPPPPLPPPATGSGISSQTPSNTVDAKPADPAPQRSANPRLKWLRLWPLPLLLALIGLVWFILHIIHRVA